MTVTLLERVGARTIVHLRSADHEVKVAAHSSYRVEVGPVDAGELAERSCLLAPSLTRILQFLDNAKLIARTTDSHDQRKSVVTLSTRGQQLFEQVAPESEALYADIEAAFGVDRLQTLYALLADFYTTIEKQDA